MAVKAVIFDLDGTLANTLNSIAYFANQALSHHGFSAIEVNEYRYLVGNGADNLVKGMLHHLGVYSEESFHNVRQMYNKNYDDNFMYLTEAYDGIIPLILALNQLGIQTCVLSNKPDGTTKKIVSTLFGDSFQVCYGKRENVKRKPDPEGIFEILKEIDVSPEETIYIGDTSTDMLTGHNANLFTIGVLWGFRDKAELEEYKADLLVETPNEILEYVLKNKN